MRTRLSVLVLVAATLSTPGCGAGSSKKTLSRLQLIAKADAVCMRRNTEFSAVTAGARNKQSVVMAAQKRAALEQAALVELSRLTPPNSIAHDWEQMLAYRRMLRQDVIQFADYTQLNNSSGVGSLAVASGNVEQQMRVIGERDGFDNCSQLG